MTRVKWAMLLERGVVQVGGKRGRDSQTLRSLEARRCEGALRMSGGAASLIGRLQCERQLGLTSAYDKRSRSHSVEKATPGGMLRLASTTVHFGVHPIVPPVVKRRAPPELFSMTREPV